MATALFGYTGLVGTHLLQHIDFSNLYNSKNIRDAIGKSFDTIYISCVPAVKWLANKFPEKDTSEIEELIEIFKTIKSNKVVLISTIDIYDDITTNSNEKTNIDFLNNHTYGKNRYLFEMFIKSNYTNYYIFRLPALFSKYIKKNILFDLLHNNNIRNILYYSSFQWYNLERLSSDIDKYIYIDCDRIYNLVTEPVNTSDIVKLFNYPIDSYNYERNAPKYSLTTIYGIEDTSYIDTSFNVLAQIKDFIDNYYNKPKFNLAVSNIICNSINKIQFYKLLSTSGIQYLEAACTKWNTWQYIFQENINSEISTIKDSSLNLYSLQSIHYGIPYNLFLDSDNYISLLDHTKNIIKLAKSNNIKILVFGSPKNRYRSDISDNSVDSIFINFFRELDNYCYSIEWDGYICIENNSKQYKCNYLNSIGEVANIVRQIDASHIKMMIDLGNIIMENDNLELIYNYKDIIKHIHISCPNMGTDIFHYRRQISILKNICIDIGYNQVITLEALNKTNSTSESETIYNIVKEFTLALC